MAAKCFYGGKSMGYECTDECPFYSGATNRCKIHPLKQTHIIRVLLDLMQEVKVLKETVSKFKETQ